MPRTTDDAVKSLLLRDYDTVDIPDLTGFIATASAFVDDVVQAAVDAGEPINTTRAELIERWVAAHSYQMSDKGYTSRSTKGASGSFQGQTGMGFDATFYGQTAVSLDPTGILDAIGKRQRASGFWGGKTDFARLDWEERN